MLPSVENLQLQSTFPSLGSNIDFPILDNQVVADLSSDQKMLYLAWESVIKGELNIELLSLTPGPISHARWLTLAVRLMYLWMSDHELSGMELENLKSLVTFVTLSYCPLWFKIKHNPQVKDSSKHLFSLVVSLRHLEGTVLQEAKKNVARNSYYAHPENLLLTMLCDEDSMVRAKAINKILEIRKSNQLGDKSVRPYKLPKIDFDCDSYTEMIDWDKEAIHEPILTCDFSKDDIKELHSKPLVLEPYPCHSQGCERAVKETSRASIRVVGWDARDGFIRASGKSRSLMKTFNSKKDFENNFI